MTVGTPAWLAASAGLPAYDATELRVIDTMYSTYDGSVLGAREGTRPGGAPLAVTLTGSPLNWNVATGVATVSGIASGVLGMYVVPVTATETGLVPAANATFPRKDIIVLSVKDAENGDATREALVVYLTGTASATPSAPAVPGKSLLLATIDVPQSGTGSPSATLNTKYTVASGGILPTATRPTAVYPGITIYNLTSGVMEYHNGTTWLPLSGGSPSRMIQAVSGAGTWTKPANAKFVKVQIWGAGGASGGCAAGTGFAEGAGGGGGGYVEKMYDAASLNATEAFTVGAGGTAVSGAAGGTGGSTTFKALTANGGVGGSFMTAGSTVTQCLAGAGGTASGGDLNASGSDGGNGKRDSASSINFGVFGGAAAGGGGGSTNVSGFAANNGAAGKLPGGGAAGGFTSNTVRPGAAGAAGTIIVTTYF